MLERAVERLHVGHKYCDIPLGLYLIRGENVVMLGELVRALSSTWGGGRGPQPACSPQDPAREASQGLECVSVEELGKAQQEAEEGGAPTVQELWSFTDGE